VSKKWRLLGSLVLLGALAARIDWGQVASTFAAIDWSLWLAAVGVYALTQVVSARRWQLLAGVLGLGGSLAQYVRYYFIGMFFNLVLPTSVGGDVVRAWYLSRQQGEASADGRRMAAFLSVFADRASGVLVLVALACAATAACPVDLPRSISGSVAALGGGALLGVAALPLLRRLPLPGERLPRLVEGGQTYLRHRRVLCAAMLLSLAVQVANVVLVWLVGEAMGLRVPPLYYGVMVPLVTLLTLLPISLNGMGLREAGTVLLLLPLGIDPTAAVTLSFLSFAVTTACSLGGVAFYLSGARQQPVAWGAAGGPGSPAAVWEVGPDADAVGGNPDQGRARQPSAAA
jgi:uncharacterized membrane protein YbhN (UPF0104 family)